MLENVAILVHNQILDTAYASVMDIFHQTIAVQNASGKTRDSISVLASRKGRVVSALGSSIRIDAHVERDNLPSVVVVPGVAFVRDTEADHSKSIDLFLSRRDVRNSIRWLQHAFDEGTTIAAGCTATLLLAEAGLLDGKTATTTWSLSSVFRERYPNVELRDDLTVTHDDRLICSGAAFAHINLALYLVGLKAGPAVRNKVASQLIINESNQQSPMVDYNLVANLPAEITQAEQWIRNHLDEPIKLSDIADAVATTPRTLARRFRGSIGRTPIQFLQMLRIQEAIRLLKTTDDSFEVISNKVGYHNPAGLRRVFRRETGRLPSHFRRIS